MDRSNFKTVDSVAYVLHQLGLPDHALESLHLPGSDALGVPSSYKVGHLAQASIALSGLTAALLHSQHVNSAVPEVSVSLSHAVIEFKSERLFTIDGKRPLSTHRAIGGLHKTSDGYIRIHDGFVNHREGAKKLLGCEGADDRDRLAKEVLKWKAVDLETAGMEAGLAMAALRSVEQWDALPQASAIADFPILIRKLSDGPPRAFGASRSSRADKCLRGLRVVEMTRVIAAPVAGKTLAAHGADVLWVTSPHLPHQPELDRDVGRGKRTLALNITNPQDKQTLDTLLTDADVFLQSYRPGSLAAKGLSPEALASTHPRGIICGTLSAYGPIGPWSQRRGFDSLVQTCSGINVSEAQSYNAGEESRVLPCQALDHASGYFLAAGVNAALYRRATEGGSYEVSVSLAGTMRYLRSLGRYEGRSGFECRDFNEPGEVDEGFFEERKSEFGLLRAVRHSVTVEGVEIGWEVMPKPLGSDTPVWL